MSVDSGLPDFASDQGIIHQVVRSEPNKDYRHIINPAYFQTNPAKFWYIYGTRYNQYVNANPHKGYHLLK
jgi:NAD-dependent SIR2 family protein deacetylase